MTFEEAVVVRDKLYDAFAELNDAVGHFRLINEREEILEEIVSATDRLRAHAVTLQEWVG